MEKEELDNDVQIKTREKCGEIYRNKSDFTYHCLFCFIDFVDVIKFHIHFYQKHNTKDEIPIDEIGKKLNNSTDEPDMNIFTQEIDSDDYSLIDIKEEDITSYTVEPKQQNYEHSQLKIKTEKVENISSNGTNRKKRDSEKFLNRIANRNNRFEWTEYKRFKHEYEFQQFLRKEKIWSSSYKNNTKKGQKRYYRCNQIKYNEGQCIAAVCLFENNQTNDLILLRKNSVHTCSNADLKKHAPIDKEIKKEIKNLYESEPKLNTIVCKIQQKFGNINPRQVLNYCRQLKKENEQNLISIVHKWSVSQFIDLNCVENNKPLIVNSEISLSFFRIFISSKCLLKNAINTEIININGVKKLSWQNHCIFIVGTSDNNGKFLGLGIALCHGSEVEDFEFLFNSIIMGLKKFFNYDFDPKILYRDSNLSLETAFINVFGENKLVKICWNHVKLKMTKKLDYLLPNYLFKKEQILEDLDLLQKSECVNTFDDALYTFENKWGAYVEFMTYLHQEWITKNKNWFEGIAVNKISSNKTLDCIIKCIEEDEEFRSKIPFSQFRLKLFEWIEKLSNLEFNKTTSSNSITDLKKNITECLVTNVYNKAPKTGRKMKSTISVEKRQRKQYDNKDWKEDTTFSSFSEAQKIIEFEKIWGFSFKNKCLSGVKRYYRCKKVPTRGEKCAASIYLHLKSNSTDVVLFRSGLQHTCDKIAFKPRKLNDIVRTEIERLNELNWKPCQIFDYFKKINFSPMPTRLQINNYVNVINERKYGIVNLNIKELESWFKIKSKIPEKISEMFIVKHFFTENNFRFFVSSKKLLENGINLSVIKADGIHKLEWIQFPIYILVTNDSNRKFCCLGVGVCSQNDTSDYEFLFESLRDGIFNVWNHQINPNILITDLNSNIKLAFSNIFGQLCKIKVCFDLVRKEIKKKLDELVIDKDIKINIIKDIETLQKSNNSNDFKVKLTLFCNKYLDYKDFLQYFQNNWINLNCNWYQGYDENELKINSNVDIEYFYKSIRTHVLFRKKMSLTNFISILNNCIEAWST